MIPQYSFPEQPIPDTPMAAGYRNSLLALPQHMAFNWMRWLRNRRVSAAAAGRDQPQGDERTDETHPVSLSRDEPCASG